jgi:hypothetical protein
VYLCCTRKSPFLSTRIFIRIPDDQRLPITDLHDIDRGSQHASMSDSPLKSSIKIETSGLPVIH